MKETVQLFILLALVAVLTACSSKTNTVKSDEFPAELIQFSPIPENPLFSGTGANTWDKEIRERGFILYEEGLYKMWYTGYNPDMAREKFLGYATSTDGIHWERYSENPVFSEKWTEDVFVFKNEGNYFMYAEGDNDVPHLLTSADGIGWEEQGDLTILTTKGDTVPAPYGTPAVWIEDGQWHLFYERNDSAIWLAKSDDKLTWTNVQDEPVLPLGPDGYDLHAVAANQIVKYNGRYFMYYHANSDIKWQAEWTSNVAMSTDLIHWKKYPGNPIVKDNFSSPILVFDGEKPSLYTMHPAVCRYSNN